MNCFSGTERSVSVAEKKQEKNYLGRKFKWKIKNFSSLGESKLYSDTFVVNENRWRLFVYPKGYMFDHLAAFLDIADRASLPNGWSKSVKFTIAVVNQINGRRIMFATEIQFTAKASGWGAPFLLPLYMLRNGNWGYLVNDTCLIEAQVFGDSMDSVYIKTESFLKSIPKRLSIPVSDVIMIETLSTLTDNLSLSSDEQAKEIMHLKATCNLLEGLVKTEEERKTELEELNERVLEAWAKLYTLRSKREQLMGKRKEVWKQTKEVYGLAEEQCRKIEGKKPVVDLGNKLKKKSKWASIKALLA